MRPLLIISFLLAFTGGYADAASFILTGSFTGHLTGNTVLTMVHLVQGEWRAAISSVLAVAAFALGTAGADWLDTDAGAPASARQLRLPLMLEGFLLLVAVACHWQIRRLGLEASVVCLCLGLGIQNGALQKCGGLSFHTTFITGMSTSVLAATVGKVSDEKTLTAPPKHSAAVLTGLMLVFAGGAMVGGLFSFHFQTAGLAAILVPWSVAMFLAFLARP